MTISAVTDTKVYDGTTNSTQTPTYQVTGLAADTLYGTDTVTGLVQAFASKDVKGTGGSTLQVTAYTVNDGNGGTDYTISFVNATGTITPASLTITTYGSTKVYDTLTTVGGATPTVSGLQGNETVTGLSESFVSPNAGLESIQLNPGWAVNDGNDGNNYAVIVNEGSAVISQAQLTITATSDTKVYDSTTTDGAVPTVSGLKGSDTVTGLSESFVSKDVLGTGDSTLVVNSGYVVNDGNSGNDYTVDSSGTALGTITPATPMFSNLTPSQTIVRLDTQSIELAGKLLSSPTASPVDQDVTITINGVATTAKVKADGSFTATIDKASLPLLPRSYVIVYAYAGDANFHSATDSSTKLTVKLL